MAYMPADRAHTALVRSMSVAENLMLRDCRRRPYARGVLLTRAPAAAKAQALMAEYDIRAPGPRTIVARLSGGNQQKVVVARELAESPKVLVAAEPTRGLDVGATEFIHRELIQKRDEGLAILLISSELDEIFSLSDAIAVIYQGRIVEVIPSAEADRERVGLLMAGGSVETAIPSADRIAQAAAEQATRDAASGAAPREGHT